MAPRGFIAVGTTLYLTITTLAARDPLLRRVESFDWDAIQPSTNLSWSSCYETIGTFQCARFQVPLRYADPTGEQGAVALVMSPSNLSKDDQNYRGPVLFNPGGPGVSGVDFIVDFASDFRQFLGPQFDLVGFDPRGVGATTPPLSVFKDGLEADKFYSGLAGNVNESVSSLGELYAQQQVLGKLANARAKDVIETVSTPAVARDMMGIVEAFGQEKLQYWGVSYGTVLGATFAAMFPDKVGRLLLDGVVNSHDYYAGNWSSSFLDLEQAYTRYLDACVDAGPSACPIYENTTDLVRARIGQLADKLHLNPLPVFNDSESSSINFGTVGYTNLTGTVFAMMFRPYTYGASVAQDLVSVEKGDASALLGDLPFLEDSCEVNPSKPFVAGLDEIRAAITCSDRVNSSQYSFEEVQQVYQELSEITPTFAPLGLASFPGICFGWNIGSADRFNASFEQNTSFPILFVTNTADVVAPKANAYNMSSAFTGSVVLEQDAIGHGSLVTLANCTLKAVHDYFVDGTMPSPGTVCPIEEKIFGSNATSSPDSMGTSGAQSQ